jgi:AcrR family transcriptional regulator
MDRFTSGKTLVYKSASIVERRRRILAEARRMIATEGVAGFNVRDLCTRAHIAQKTLYNAFGSKENVIATAMKEFFVELSSHFEYKKDYASLDGYIERMVSIHGQFIHARPYTSAIVAVYSSFQKNKVIRTTMRTMWDESLQPFVSGLADRKALATGMTPARFIDLLASTTFAVIADWCMEEIADEDYIDRVVEASLIVIAGTTKGRASAEARRWLEDVRAQNPAWMEMRKLAQVRPPGADLRVIPGGEVSPAAARRKPRKARVA